MIYSTSLKSLLIKSHTEWRDQFQLSLFTLSDIG